MTLPHPLALRRSALLIAATLASSWASAGLGVTRASAQQPDVVKEIMGRAQGETERRAVDDLIKKLQQKSAPSPAPVDAATVAPVVPAKTEPVVAPPVAAPTTVVTPAIMPTVPPVVASPVPIPAPAPVAAMPAPAAPVVPALPELVSTPPLAPIPTAVTPPAPPVVVSAPAPAAPASRPTTGIAAAPVVAAREQLPSVDLEIYFGFASAEISSDSLSALVILGRTLSDVRLADQTFVIGGYTDGKGKPDYNLRLSQQRADAVRNFLVTEFKIDAKRLISKGFGKSQFKDPAQPFANENRRVQIINWTNKLARKS